MSPHRTAVAFVALVCLLLAACSGVEAPSSTSPASSEDDSSTSTTSTTSTTTSTRPTTTSTTTTSSPPAPVVYGDGTWERVDLEDCECSDGSDYAIGVRSADPRRVVFHLQGGGACFSAESCDPESGIYSVQARGIVPRSSGIWDTENSANPLANHSMVNVPYCTGDLHLGTRTHDYGDGVVVNHVGGRNARAAIDELVARFPDATQIVVTGESAGSAPAPLYAGLLADRFPDAQVSVVADASGAYGGAVGVGSLISERWGAIENLPDWDGAEELATAGFGLPDLFGFVAAEHPDIVLTRHDYAYDRVQTFFASLAGFGTGDLREALRDTEEMIEADGVELSSYLAPGTSHTVLGNSRLYTEEVGDVALIDWLLRAVSFRTPGDVTCEDCAAGAT